MHFGGKHRSARPASFLWSALTLGAPSWVVRWLVVVSVAHIKCKVKSPGRTSGRGLGQTASPPETWFLTNTKPSALDVSAGPERRQTKLVVRGRKMPLFLFAVH